MKFHYHLLATAFLTCLASVAYADTKYGGRTRLRKVQQQEPAGRPIPQAAGDVLSTKIDATENSVVPPEIATTENGSMMKYVINFRRGATYTTVHFKDFNLGDRCSMQVSGEDLPDGRRQVYKMTGRGKMELGTFWSQHVKGDTMVLEIRCAKDAMEKENIQFEIDEVAVGFADVAPDTGSFGESLCGSNDLVNAVCYSSTSLYTKARAVARLLIDGRYYCTGWLASSENHFITNEHCITNADEAANTDFDFGAEAPTCSTNNCASCYRGTVFSGASFIQDNRPLDYALMQFTTTNPQATFGFLEIDDRPAELNEQIYIPQHPGGAAKEIGVVSTHAMNSGGFCRIDSINENSCTGTENDYGYYCDTMGGTSGSPVLARSTNKVIALHHCRGSDPCTQSGGDPNRGVPITLINAEIKNIISGTPSTPTTPAPTPAPVPATPAPTISCSSGEKVFTLDLTTDRFGSETTWTLVNACTGATVLSNGPYSSGTVTRYVENYCVEDGVTYTFTMFDSFGDGLCCLYGEGSYEIYYDDVLVGSSAVFSSIEVHTFGTGPTCTPAPTPAPTVATAAPTASPPCVFGFGDGVIGLYNWAEGLFFGGGPN